MLRNLVVGTMSALVVLAGLSQSATAGPEYRVSSLSVLKEGGGRVDWHPSQNLIAFDKEGADGYFDVYTMKADGSAESCLTCSHPDLPNRHTGNPAWHPSGDFMVFQAEKAVHPGLSIGAQPGLGAYSDLWVLRISDNSAQRVVTVGDTTNNGTLHPHFSHGGTKLSWSEMYLKPDYVTKGNEFGYWKLRVADFVAGPSPHLENVQDLEPGGSPAFYENHGFTPDDRKLVFTRGPLRGDGVSALVSTDIFSYDVPSGILAKLTDEGYNEHGIVSPDGTRIVWMTDVGTPASSKGTELWLMNPDGSNKTQLTCLNYRDGPHYLGDYAIAADSSWSPTQDRLVLKAAVGGPLDEVVVLLNLGPGTPEKCIESRSWFAAALVFLIILMVVIVLLVFVLTRKHPPRPDRQRKI